MQLLVVLKALPRYKWVMWRDCDSFFQNSSIAVEHIIAGAATARHLIADATANELWAAQNSTPAAWSQTLGSGSMDLIVSEDGFMLNTGVFFIRSCRWAVHFLQRAYGALHVPIAHDWDMPQTSDESVTDTDVQLALARMLHADDPFPGTRAWEQASILFELVGGYQARDAAAPFDRPAQAKLLANAAHVQAVPQQWVNSYPHEIAQVLVNYRTHQSLHTAY
ncbi:MAG: hypothetical protein EOO65_02045, partial [Methanosarcinales archaeon]